jgi:hypothetical protein
MTAPADRADVLRTLYQRAELLDHHQDRGYAWDVAWAMVERTHPVPLGAAVAQRLQLSHTLGGGYAAGSPGSAASEAVRAVATWLRWRSDAYDQLSTTELAALLYEAADHSWDLP